MGIAEANALRRQVAVEGQGSAFTQNQALAALRLRPIHWRHRHRYNVQTIQELLDHSDFRKTMPDDI
jgi:hypothetical protein